MRTALKLTGGIITLLVVLFIITIIVLTNVVNPNDYRKNIDSYVFHKTGRHLVIGKVAWSFIPWLGVDLKKVQLTNPSGFKGPNLANVDEVKIKMRFWPLLTGSVQFGKIVVTHADINLVTNSAGKQNWSAWSKAATHHQTRSKAPTSTPKAPIRQLQIAGIRVIDSTIKVMNQKTRTTTLLSDFNLNTGAINNAQNFPLTASFNLQQRNAKNSTFITAHARANFDLQRQIYKITHTVITTKTRRPNLPVLMSNLKGTMIINLPAQTLTFSPLAAQIANMNINARLQINQLLHTPRINLTVSSHDTALQPFITKLQGKSQLKGTLSFNAAITTSGASSKALLANLNGKGNMTITNGVIAGINLNNLLAVGNAIIHQQSAPPQRQSWLQTSFSSLSGTYVIHNGVLRNNDLRLVAGQVGAHGAGTVNLNGNTIINYVLTAEYRSAADTTQPLAVPIIIRGSLFHPSIKPDYGNIAKQVLTNALQKHGGHLNLNTLFKGL